MQTVRFKKQWRGHQKGKVVDLTDERAAELIKAKFCVAVKETTDAEPPPPPKPVAEEHGPAAEESAQPDE